MMGFLFRLIDTLCKSVGVQTSLKILKYQLSSRKKWRIWVEFSNISFLCHYSREDDVYIYGIALLWLCWIEIAVVDPSIVTLIVCKATLFMHLSDPSWSLREKQTFFRCRIFLWVLSYTLWRKHIFGSKNIFLKRSKGGRRPTERSVSKKFLSSIFGHEFYFCHGVLILPIFVVL